MPIFAFEHGKIRDLYVLGDVHGLIARMTSAFTNASLSRRPFPNAR
jgi:hypothetical protein